MAGSMPGRGSFSTSARGRRSRYSRPVPAAAAEPFDANTGRFLRRVGRPLTVLADPSAAAVVRPADAPDLLPLRTLARDVRQHTLDHLDAYLARPPPPWSPPAAASTTPPTRPPPAGRRAPRPVARRAAVAVCDEIGLPPGAGPAVVVGAAFVVAETGQVCLASDDPAVAAAAEPPCWCAWPASSPSSPGRPTWPSCSSCSPARPPAGR